MTKKIIIASVLSLCVCGVHAQAELLVGAQYIGQFFGGSIQKEQRAKKDAERQALAEEGKLKNEEAHAVRQLHRFASDKAKKEASAEKRARYEALEEKYKEDQFQLELAHVKMVNKIGKNNGALAEEKVVYKHKQQTLTDNYRKQRNLIDEKARIDTDELTAKYREEGMVEINRKYRPPAEGKDVSTPPIDSPAAVN